jgi:transposase
MNEASPVSQTVGYAGRACAQAQSHMRKGPVWVKDIRKFVGLDVHQDTIAVGVADGDGGRGRYWGTIPYRPEAVRTLMERLGPNEYLVVCYEAGPTGYGLQRLLTSLGITYIAVAPALTPTRPGDRVKTDRRDAVRLAELLRAGELAPVWVPGEEDEVLRDLVRVRRGFRLAYMPARSGRTGRG